MHIFQVMTAFAFAWTIASCDKKPWVHHPTSTHPHINPAPTLYLGKPQAGTAIDVLNNHHDWSECINMHIRRRDVNQTQLFTIPSQLPDTILSTLQCNAAPARKSNDVHCGNVFNVLTTYCRVHILDWDRFEVGNQTFLHRHYMRGLPNALHLAYMRRNHQDDFNVTVTKVETPCNATEKAWKKHTPDMFDRCFQSLWGTWTGCNNNKGRGGSVIAGCYNYTLSVLDPGSHLDPTRDDPDSYYVWPGPGKPPGTPWVHHVT